MLLLYQQTKFILVKKKIIFSNHKISVNGVNIDQSSEKWKYVLLNGREHEVKIKLFLLWIWKISHFSFSNGTKHISLTPTRSTYSIYAAFIWFFFFLNPAYSLYHNATHPCLFRCYILILYICNGTQEDKIYM